jgi:hypothetical protein
VKTSNLTLLASYGLLHGVDRLVEIKSWWDGGGGGEELSDTANSTFMLFGRQYLVAICLNGITALVGCNAL